MKGETRIVCGKVAAVITTRVDLVSKSGKVIPEYEPLFTFRAQDVLALPRLLEYLKDCEENGCNLEHLTAIRDDIAAFEQFQRQCPDKMKLPD